ncbi:MAG: transcription antitermination factor NusB [Acidobacteria bacterium]|nr:transcription antitermination factor NusB [Acidobacteriota bacterium]
MLYQWEIGGGDLDTTLATYSKHHAPSVLADAPDLAAFAQQLVRGAVDHLPQIDALLDEQAKNWRLSRMAVTDRIILRLAVYEFLQATDTPPPIVINEAVELAKTFSGEEAARFVNGVLDGIRRRLEHEAAEHEHGEHGEP